MLASFEPVRDITTIPIIHYASPYLVTKTLSRMSFSMTAVCRENRIIEAGG